MLGGILIAWLLTMMSMTEARMRVEILDVESNYTFTWNTVPQADGLFRFNVSANTRGYLGFGLSDTGTMAGADLLIVWGKGLHKVKLNDFFATQNGPPRTDTISADWRLESYRRDFHTGTPRLYASIVRPLITGDSQEDLPITANAIHVLYCWSDRTMSEYHGKEQRGARKLKLLDHDDMGANLASSITACSPLFLLSLLARVQPLPC